MGICKKSRIIRGAALLCTLTLALSGLPAWAADDIEELENQTSALESELEGINQDILSLSEDISSTEMQVEILNGEILRTSDALEEAEKNEEKQYEDMKIRIKYMYEHGNASLLELLFSAENMADFLNKADFIESLSEYDRDALDQLRNTHQEIADQKSVLEEQQASLNELQASLKTQQEELQKKADETSTNLEEVNARLEKAREEEAARIAAEQAAAERAAAEAAAQAAAQAGSSGGSSGGGGGYNNSVINGGSTSASADEVTLLAALLDCEAIHDYDAMLAVATVVMNRVESPRFGNSITSVIYAQGQFEPVWTGRLEARLNAGPTDLAMQVAQDAVNGSRLAAVADCYYFLYAGSTNRDGVNIGNNLFFVSW